MNFIKTSSYEGDYPCPICQENFKETDIIWLIKHYDRQGNKAEKVSESRKRKHMFHAYCLQEYIDRSGDPSSHEVLCPLDREKISYVSNVKYSEIIILNIMNFSHNYYELIDKIQQNQIQYVSVIDRININYKDINGNLDLLCLTTRQLTISPPISENRQSSQ